MLYRNNTARRAQLAAAGQRRSWHAIAQGRFVIVRTPSPVQAQQLCALLATGNASGRARAAQARAALAIAALGLALDQRPTPPRGGLTAHGLVAMRVAGAAVERLAQVQGARLAYGLAAAPQAGFTTD